MDGSRFPISWCAARFPLQSNEKWSCGRAASRALKESDYRDKPRAAGFDNIEIEPTRIYSVAQSKDILAEADLDSEELAAQIDNKFMSAFVRARKPA